MKDRLHQRSAKRLDVTDLTLVHLPPTGNESHLADKLFILLWQADGLGLTVEADGAVEFDQGNVEEQLPTVEALVENDRVHTKALFGDHLEEGIKLGDVQGPNHHLQLVLLHPVTTNAHLRLCTANAGLTSLTQRRSGPLL